jgi:FlaA1/EpsC-like NDP-sugar epimerase
MRPLYPTLPSSQQWLARLLSMRNRYFAGLDLLILCAVPALALILRTDGFEALRHYGPALAVYTLFGLAVHLYVFNRFGLYRRYWRYASVDDLVQVTAAVAVATALITAFFFAMHLPAFSSFRSPSSGLYPLFALSTVPRSIPFIGALLVLAMVGSVRFSVRLAERYVRRRPAGGTRQVIVFGAGEAGQKIVKEMQANPQLALDPVAFLDDDPHKHGLSIHGITVAGGRDQLPDVVRSFKIDQAIIAMPTASGKTIREVLALCEQVGVPAKTIPGMGEILDGSVSVSHLRDVQIEDLLRREPVWTDTTAVEQMLRGCRVLVTGAGGSIGSELCRQIARCGPAELVLLGHGENSVFAIASELRQRWPDLPLRPVIADVRDLRRLGRVFELHRPQAVFHAAAHKHVPLMEENASEAVTNNVQGTAHLLRLAEARQVARLVLISTDKAVNPSSVMGATKRVAELLVVESARRSGRPYVAVRFGNVLGSRGSVVPIFKEQIARGGPVTVTHPDMQRYFMTIPEAVQLVLQAAALGRGSEVFLLDMGEPVRIVDLAKDLVTLSGLEVGRDIDIVYTGLRPGEKLFEELSVAGEQYGPTVHDKVFVAPNGGRPPAWSADLEDAVADLIALAHRGDDAQVRAKLSEIVPEYRPARPEELEQQRATADTSGP